MADSFLPDYLSRIGFAGRPVPDLETLRALQHAHRLAIPFENLDIPLGRGISLRPEALADKIVNRRRGGYCFEQNALFLSMLHEIGFAARPLLARVWLMAEGIPPLTHTLNLVTIGGFDYLADAGFGGSPMPVMPLTENEPMETPDGSRHRLVRDPEHAWMLERDGGNGGGWQRQYGFTLAPVFPIDLEMGNHWTSTRPGTRFTSGLIVSIPLPDGHASLIDRRLAISRRGETTIEEITDAAAYRAVLAERFGLELPEEEVGKLGLF